MGVIVAKLSRPFKNYNIENRAYRELERQRKAKVGVPAPKHHDHGPTSANESTDVDMKRDKLIERVGRMDIKTEVVPSKVDGRRLPQDAQSTPDFTYGFYIPSTVPRGKVTLSQVIEILGRYKDEYPRYTTDDIADQYKLAPAKVESMVKHFQMLNIFIPRKVIEKASEMQQRDKSNLSLVERLTTVDEKGVERSDEMSGEVAADRVTFGDRNPESAQSDTVSYDTVNVRHRATDEDGISNGKVNESDSKLSNEEVTSKTTR